MNHLFRIALAISLCLAVPSCSLVGKGLRKMPWKKKKKPMAGKSDSNQVIGVIEMVNPEQKFVLIRTQMRIAISPGQELSAMDGAGGFARLKVTPEKKQDFLTADIVDGNPRSGNIVMFKPVAHPAVPPAIPGQPPGPPPPPVSPPPPDLPVQPPPVTPVLPSEFTRPGVPGQSSAPSPIPPQPAPAASSGSAVPEPGQIQLPPVVR